MKLSESFVEASTIKPTKRRLIMTLFGGQKSGKTHFALTAPGPIVYFALEPGLEGVVEQFNKTKKIYIGGVVDKNGNYPSYVFAKPAPKGDRKGAEYLEHVRNAAAPVWEKLMTDWTNALKSDARTLVMDTASAAYDLGRFAYLGMAGKAAPKDDPYGIKSSAVKTLMRGLVSDTFSCDKNVIFIAREKEVWKDGEPSGEFKSDGWEGLPYECSVVARISKRTFAKQTLRKIVVVDSRIDGDFAQGLTFADNEGKDIVTPADFVTLASTITSSDPSEWK